MIELVPDALSVPLRSLRFLVVDDDPDQRFLVARTLNRMGMADVVEASSGRTALEALAEADRPVDVVISDLQMPDMDGMELIRRIGERSLPVSVILASALDDGLLASAATMTQAYGVRIIGTIGKRSRATKLFAVAAPIRSAARGRRNLASTRHFPLEPDQVLAGIAAGQFEPFSSTEGGSRDGARRGAEALARWRHPAYGLLGPESFLPPLAAAGYLDELS
jgi:CheY-like chemotaxis protein